MIKDFHKTEIFFKIFQMVSFFLLLTFWTVI